MDNIERYLEWLEYFVNETQRLNIEDGEYTLCSATIDIINRRFDSKKISTFHSMDDWYRFLSTIIDNDIEEGEGSREEEGSREKYYIHTIRVKIIDHHPVSERRRQFIHHFALVQHLDIFYLCDSWEGIHKFKCRRRRRYNYEELADILVNPIINMLNLEFLDGDRLNPVFDDDEGTGWSDQRRQLEEEGIDTDEYRIPIYDFYKPHSNDILIHTYKFDI